MLNMETIRRRMAKTLEMLETVPTYSTDNDKGIWKDSVVEDRCKASQLYFGSYSYRFLAATNLYNWYFSGSTTGELSISHALVRAISGATLPGETFTGQPLFPYVTKDPTSTWYCTDVTSVHLVTEAPTVAELTDAEMALLYQKQAGKGEMELQMKSLKTQSLAAHTTLSNLFDHILDQLEVLAQGRPSKELYNGMGFHEAMYRYCQPAAYLSMCSLRLLGKDKGVAATIFSKAKFQDNIAKFGGWVGTNFPRPSREFVKSIGSAVLKAHDNMLTALTHLLSIQLNNALSTHEVGTVNSACLLHLNYTGISLVKNALESARVCNTTLAALSQGLYLNTTCASWDVLAKTLSTYTSPGSPHKSKLWSWCKLLDDGYLTELQNAKHVPLCSILHGVLSAAKPADYAQVGDSYWVHKADRNVYQNHLSYGKRFWTKRISNMQPLEENADLLEPVRSQTGIQDDRALEQEQIQAMINPSGSVAVAKPDLLSKPMREASTAPIPKPLILAPALDDILDMNERDTGIGNASFTEPKLPPKRKLILVDHDVLDSVQLGPGANSTFKDNSRNKSQSVSLVDQLKSVLNTSKRELSMRSTATGVPPQFDNSAVAGSSVNFATGTKPVF